MLPSQVGGSGGAHSPLLQVRLAEPTRVNPFLHPNRMVAPERYWFNAVPTILPFTGLAGRLHFCPSDDVAENISNSFDFFKSRPSYSFLKKIEDISPFCEVNDTPVLDFW